MSNPIELNIMPAQEPVQIVATSVISNEQLQALITLLNTDPPTLVLPQDKTFADVRNFNIRVLPNGAIVRAVF